jgi:hypothetical protein
MTTPEIAETSLASLPLEQVYPIALRLPYRHLLRFCRTATRYRDICADPVFWAEKANFIYGLPISQFFQPTSQVPNPRDTPQRRYLQILTQHRDCERGSEQFTDVNDAMQCAIRQKDLQLADYFKSKGANDATSALVGAIESGDLNLVKHYDQGLYNVPRVLLVAGFQGQRDIVDYLLYPPNRPPRSNGPFINDALTGAAEGNHSDLIKYLLSLGGNPIYVLYGAAASKNLNLITTYLPQIDLNDPNRDYVIELILSEAIPDSRRDIVNYILTLPNLSLRVLNLGLRWASLAKNRALIRRFIELGASDMNEGLIGASRAQDKDLINDFISRGAADWNRALRVVIRFTPSDVSPNWNLINFFLDKGADDWNLFAGMAIASKNPKLIDFFMNKPITDYYPAIETSISTKNYTLLQDLLQRESVTRNQLLQAMIYSIRHGNRVAFDLIGQRLALSSWPDEVDFYLNRALLAAVGSYRANWIPDLIDLGANNLVEARDLALQHGHIELADLISQYLPELPINP